MLELAHLSWSSSCCSLCRINSLLWRRCSAPTLRLKAERMLFILFHAFMIFGLAVFLPVIVFLVNWNTGSFCVLCWQQNSSIDGVQMLTRF